MKVNDIIKELEKNYGYEFNKNDEWQYDFLAELIKDVSVIVNKNDLLPDVSDNEAFS